MDMSRLLQAVLSLALVASAAAQAPADSLVKREEEMLQRQVQLLEEKKAEIDRMEPGPRRDAMRERLAEIEKRVRDQPHVLYVTSETKFTPEMETYYARMVRRLEDCGTRNFPKRNGTSVYGKGYLAMTIDAKGYVVKTEVLESTGNATLDLHMQRVVRATSPFGSMPTKPTVDTVTPYTRLVIYTSFDFNHSDQPSESVPKNERCKWR